MATALQTVIAALHARVSDAVDPALKQQLADALEQHAAEQAEIQDLRDSYASLKTAVDTLTGGADIGGQLSGLREQISGLKPQDLGPLTDGLTAVEARVDALEARNADDDAAATTLTGNHGSATTAGGVAADAVAATATTKSKPKAPAKKKT